MIMQSRLGLVWKGDCNQEYKWNQRMFYYQKTLTAQCELLELLFFIFYAYIIDVEIKLKIVINHKRRSQSITNARKIKHFAPILTSFQPWHQYLLRIVENLWKVRLVLSKLRMAWRKKKLQKPHFVVLLNLWFAKNMLLFRVFS